MYGVWSKRGPGLFEALRVADLESPLLPEPSGLLLPPVSTTAPPPHEPLSAKPKGYWDLVAVQFKKNKIAVLSVYVIGVLFLLAAWAPILVSGKPYTWTALTGDANELITTHPWFRELVAPRYAIDLIFNGIFLSTLAIPLMLGARWGFQKFSGRRLAVWPFVIAGFLLALLPLLEPARIGVNTLRYGISALIVWLVVKSRVFIEKKMERELPEPAFWFVGIYLALIQFLRTSNDVLETSLFGSRTAIERFACWSLVALGVFAVLWLVLKLIQKPLPFWLVSFVLLIPLIFHLNPGQLLRSEYFDRTPYTVRAKRLDASKGENATFTLVRQDPISQTGDLLTPPDITHILGTDSQERDTLARMLYGARISISVGFVAEGIAVILGIFFGALAGFYRGWVDIAISRFIEVVVCFPAFFLILVIIAYAEQRSVFHIMVVIGLISWTGIARQVRGEFLKLNELDYVQSARALGAAPLRVMFRHMLPNAMGPVLVAAAFGVAGAILTESGLSYLGFGAEPPTPTWGEMISQGNLTGKWWLIVFPGFSIFLTVTIYNLAGDGLRDAMDPKMRK